MNISCLSDTVEYNRDAPMYAARVVRKNRYAWPGGYALVLVTADGGILCADCVATEFHQIASAVRDDNRHGGWYPAAYDCAANWDSDDAPCCDHCSRAIE